MMNKFILLRINIHSNYYNNINNINNDELGLNIAGSMEIINEIMNKLYVLKEVFTRDTKLKLMCILFGLLAAGEIHLIDNPDLEKVNFLITESEQNIVIADELLKYCQGVYNYTEPVYNQLINRFNL
jgi:hypothetical protein